MANFLDKIATKIGLQQQKQKFDLSCQNLTTMDFYSMKPVYVKEMIPNEKLVVDMSVFTRLSPLVNPMLANVKLISRAFFVPFRTVFEAWNAYITQATAMTAHSGTGSSSSSKKYYPTKVPTFKANDLLAVLMNYSTPINVNDTTFKPLGEYDFVNFNTTPNTKNYYRKFTTEGKRIYDILLNLGYSFNFIKNNDYYSEDIEFSSLPLLAYAKIWCDWFKNTQYENEDIDFIEGLFKRKPVNAEVGNPSSGSIGQGGFSLSFTELKKILEGINKIYYRNDYFASAFDNPMGPNTKLPNTIKSGVIDGNSEFGQVFLDGSKNTPVLNTQSGPITHSGLSYLEAITDYVKRLQMAGIRTLDRYFAEFGIHLDSAKLDRSNYLGKFETVINISDVMQTSSDTDIQPLGSYAGKGIGYENGKFTFETDEFGMFIITSVVEPRTSVVQGFDRQVLHINRDEFFTPEYDCLGYQAIAQGELFSDYRGYSVQGTSEDNNVGFGAFKTNHGYDPRGVFGYTSRYAEYKCGKDKMTGDFRLPTRNGNMETWHMNRLLANGNDVTSSDLSKYVHSMDYITPDGSLYNRVFADREQIFDHFIVIFNFDVTSFANMKSMLNGYEFHGDGRDVAIQVGGTRLDS